MDSIAPVKLSLADVDIRTRLSDKGRLLPTCTYSNTGEQGPEYRHKQNAYRGGAYYTCGGLLGSRMSAELLQQHDLIIVWCGQGSGWEGMYRRLGGIFAASTAKAEGP